jgi:hypothetical protein
MCVINGASLFTSNIAYMAAAYIQRKSSAGQGLFVLLLSYFMNLAGGAGFASPQSLLHERWQLCASTRRQQMLLHMDGVLQDFVELLVPASMSSSAHFMCKSTSYGHTTHVWTAAARCDGCLHSPC